MRILVNRIGFVLELDNRARILAYVYTDGHVLTSSGRIDDLIREGFVEMRRVSREDREPYATAKLWDIVKPAIEALPSGWYDIDGC